MFADGNWERVIEPDFPVRVEASNPLPTISAASFAGREVPQRLWAVKDWLPGRAVTLMAGGGGTGKSLLTQQWLAAISLGDPFLGMETVKQTPTLYITCEDDTDEAHRRAVDIAHALRCRLEDMTDAHLLSRSGEQGNEIGTYNDKRVLQLSEFFTRIEATISAMRPGVVALDNVAHLYAGNENVRSEVTQFVNALVHLAIKYDVAVILVGHPAKALGSEYSGSTGWENAVRSRLFIERPEDEDDDTVQRVMVRGKSNYASKGAKVAMAWHKGAFVAPSELPADDGMDPGSAAALMNERFLDCLAECTAQRRSVSDSPYSRNYAPKVFAGMPTAKKAKMKEMQMAMERLLLLRTIAGSQELWTSPGNRHPLVGLARIG